MFTRARKCTTRREATSCEGCCLPDLLPGIVFCGSGARKYVFKSVIPFVACVLKYWAVGLDPRHLHSPGLRVSHWIVDSEFVYERVRGCARESLDNTGFLVDPSDRTKRRPPELQSSLIIKIGCFDDKRVAFPLTARIAQVLADRLRQMRAAIERNEPSVMDHFRQNHHVARGLRDSVGIVVGDWKYWRPCTRPPGAPLGNRTVLGSVTALFSSTFRALGNQLLCRLAQRRSSAARGL